MLHTMATTIMSKCKFEKMYPMWNETRDRHALTISILLFQLSLLHSIIITKHGESEQCSKNSMNPSWGCIHDGNDGYIWNAEDTRWKDHSVKETAYILNAAGGTFYLTSKHVFNAYYESYYDEDYKIPSEMLVKINSVERGIFKHEGNVDTHIQKNGKLKPNPAYNKEVKVEIKCTNDCSCQLNEVDI